MNRTQVVSSNLVSVGWEPTIDRDRPWVVPMHGILEIEFKGGAVYRYSDVPGETYRAIVEGRADGSVGKTFNALVRTQGYRYERVS